MPPPRRRRPVQPATRVRLPRNTRPGSASVAEEDEDNGTLTATASQTSLAPDETSPGPAEDTDLDEDDAEDEAGEEDQDEDEADEEEPEPVPVPSQTIGTDSGARRGLRLPVALAGVAVVLGGLAVWFAVEAGNSGSGVNTQNLALLNSSATTEVNRQVTAAVNTIFSYNYADTAKTRSAAQALLTGKAIQEYNTLFKLVEQDAPTEKLVLTTTVTNSGVSMLTATQAQVLVFANQQDTAGSTRSTTDAGAMFSVDAVLQGHTWKISNIDTFSAGT
jgi:Mce-associated membrane protein